LFILDLESGLVVLDIERPRPVEVDAETRSSAAHRHQPEWGRFWRVAALRRVIRLPGNQGALAQA
jgi:hypothetical protein